MSKKTWLLDIEVYENYFCIGIMGQKTKKRILYEVSEERDNRKEIYEFCTKFSGFLITFNGIYYDEMVLSYIVSEWGTLEHLSKKRFCSEVKKFSNLLIDDDYDKVKKYKWMKKPWISVDLFCFWAKSLRLSKKISLKSLAVQLNYPIIQELPYHPESILKLEDLPILRHYNLQHDLGILDLLYDALKEEIDLREYVQKEYGIECFSMDAPKISSEYLLEDYCRKTFKKDEDEKYWEYKKRIRNTKYVPKPWKLGEYIPKVNFKTKIFQDLQEEIRNSDNTFEKEFYYQKNETNVVISLGIGGIHILNENETYLSKIGYSIRDQDVRSLYPTLLDNYKLIRDELTIVLDKYLELKEDRVQAKRNKLQKKDTFLKLCLNGFTGIADSDVTWLYSPEHLIALRVLGQFIQLRVLEELSEIGIQVISNNTDGTTAIIPDHLLDEYHRIGREIEKEFNIDWEYAVIDKIVYKNVNNYYCKIVKEYAIDKDLKEIDVKIHEKPKIKRKGLFKLDFDEKGYREIPLADSVNELVVAKCLNLYYGQGIRPEEVIGNPDKYNLHIYDFCKSNKINRDYTVYWDNKKQQRLNRYYFSKTAPYLFKRKHDKGTFNHVNVGLGVILFNTYQEKTWDEYGINKQYYISKVNDIITDINNKNQLSLF